MKFQETIDIEQPVETVFTFTTEIDNNHLWQTDILEAKQTSEGDFGLGATYRCVNEFLGRRIETEGVISEFEPEKKCTFKFLSGDVTGESTYIFEPSEGGTRFTTLGDLNMNLFSLGKWLISHFAKSQIKADLKRLKQILENGCGQGKRS
jgi:hypothetical protein